MKPFWIGLGIFGLLFSILFSFRLDVFNNFHLESATLSPSSLSDFPEKDAWMNILLKDRKIGSSHTVFSKIENGYRLEETVFVRLNTMGLTQDMILKTSGRFNSDFTLSSFEFEMGSGRFHFSCDLAMKLSRGYAILPHKLMFFRGRTERHDRQNKLSKYCPVCRLAQVFQAAFQRRCPDDSCNCNNRR